MNLTICERELKKRLAYPYVWGQRQGDDCDRLTDFVYQARSFRALLAESERRFSQRADGEQLRNYALNRWYNFWSAMAVEQIFCALERVAPHPQRKDRLVDFTIDGIPFDHKTSVYPQGFRVALAQAQRDPAPLIAWLYANQSQQRRKHLHNRLFIVLHASDGAHWKLKAELGWLETLVAHYIAGFDHSALHRFTFEAERETLADVIWACR